jgi:hypothetical protein
MKSTCRTSICAFTLLIAATTSHASELLLDWDTLTWQPEGQTNLSETYAIGSAQVVVTIGGNTGALDNIGTLSPRIDDSQTGGLTPAQRALIISTDYAVGAVDRPVTISFDFSSYAGGVSDLSFSLFDIDSSLSYVDEVMIVAVVNGSVVDPSALLAGPANQVTGSNTVAGTDISPPTSGEGNVGVAFAYTGITQLLITYSDGSFAGNAALQSMGIHDIGYTVVPLPGGLLLFGSALIALVRKRRQ